MVDLDPTLNLCKERDVSFVLVDRFLLFYIFVKYLSTYSNGRTVPLGVTFSSREVASSLRTPKNKIK